MQYSIHNTKTTQIRTGVIMTRKFTKGTKWVSTVKCTFNSHCCCMIIVPFWNCHNGLNILCVTSFVNNLITTNFWRWIRNRRHRLPIINFPKNSFWKAVGKPKTKFFLQNFWVGGSFLFLFSKTTNFKIIFYPLPFSIFLHLCIPSTSSEISSLAHKLFSRLRDLSAHCIRKLSIYIK